MRNKRWSEMVKSINEFMGISIFILGAAKAILITMAILQAGIIIGSIFSGSSTDVYNFSNVGVALGFAEIILGGISMMMCILNINVKSGTIIGYLMMVGAVLLELVLPGILFCYVQCGIFMKAGSMIRKKNVDPNRYYPY